MMPFKPNTLDEPGKFVIYSIERYRQIKGLSGREVIRLFNEWQVLEFIREFFDLLHLNGDQCLVQDIDDYIARKKAEA